MQPQSQGMIKEDAVANTNSSLVHLCLRLHISVLYNVFFCCKGMRRINLAYTSLASIHPCRLHRMSHRLVHSLY